MSNKKENFNFQYQKEIAIVASPYYKKIYENLLKGALSELSLYNINFEIINVDGALEIPTAINMVKNKFEGFIALGCVIKGETSHYEIVSNNSSKALTKLGLKGIYIGNGILTVNNYNQAIERSDPKIKNKGKDAARALITLLFINEKYNRKWSLIY